MCAMTREASQPEEGDESDSSYEIEYEDRSFVIGGQELKGIFDTGSFEALVRSTAQGPGGLGAQGPRGPGPQEILGTILKEMPTESR